MPNDDSILVLTTREKDWWWSLQEITRAIEHVWTNIARCEQESVRTLCVPIPPEIQRSLHATAARVKCIVITNVTPETVQAALLLRTHMTTPVPMILYVQGDSTEGFHAFGELKKALTENDLFVTSCEAEAVATRYCFPKAQVSVIPFPLVDQFKVAAHKALANPAHTRLVYIGRVSTQKNLHTLLFALWILSSFHGYTPKVTLDVYGGEDNLGSPNMGLESLDYGAYLRRLSASLGLADIVTWHGLKPRDWLFYDVHQEPHVLVSPTLHSDENFGSSVLASLVNGHQVVTTAWGGHFAFQDWFPQQLTLVPVHRSSMGPVVHPGLLAGAISGAANGMAPTVENATLEAARAQFSESSVTARTVRLLGLPGRAPAPLEMSSTQQFLDERRALFGGGRKIYTAYDDPVAHIFFAAYGMGEPLAFDGRSRYVLAPWVSCSGRVLRIDDPHRGPRAIGFDALTSDLSEAAICPSLQMCRLPENLLKDLVVQGYAFSLTQGRSAIASAPSSSINGKGIPC